MTGPLGAFTISPDHPALPGHFPGNPVVPGVVLLDELLSLLPLGNGELAGLPAVRFTRPVRPGERVDVSCTADPTTGLPSRFACHVSGAEVLSGTLLLR